jgi:hypothetical protein
MRRMAASVLVFEAFIALFFGLVVAKLDHSDGWVAAVVLGAASVLLSGMMRFRWAYGAGWVLQAGFIVSGVFVADMYVLGAIFAALWWAGLHYGAKADQIKAERMAAVQAESERTGATTEVAETENSGLDDAAAAGNAGNEDARPDARQPGTGRPTLV